MKRAKPLVGAAGVHYVCSLLSINGLIALPTVRNSKGPDVVVLSDDGSLKASLQVKTISRRGTQWIMGKDYQKWNAPTNYYVFVRYYNEKFDAFMASASDVIAQVDRAMERRKKVTSKGFRPSLEVATRQKACLAPLEDIQFA